MSEKSKTIFRTMKDKDNPFVMIDRRPLENPSLSWKAKGILSYILSRPDNWTVQIGDLVKRSTDKAFAIRGAIKELIAAGHIYRREERDAKTGRFLRYVLEVYELPFTGSPLIGFPHAGNPLTGNLPLNNTDLNDKKRNGDAVDFEIQYHLKPKSIKDAFAKYFKLTPNWEAKYNRQYLEWLIQNGATPEQVEHAADLWRKDKRFNWSAPDLKKIQEHWLELIADLVPVQEDNSTEAYNRRVYERALKELSHA